ncbi:hypothetical protein J6590_087595 [Homalodisca vitripennis]|nr:hypothetical protein J6590_087595 [Homalodisca vitripennis]
MVDPGTGTKSLLELGGHDQTLTQVSRGTLQAGRVMLVLLAVGRTELRDEVWLQTLPAREMLVTPLQHSANHSPQPLM